MLNNPTLTFLTTTPVHQLVRAVEDFVVVFIASKLVVKELPWRSLLLSVFFAVLVGELEHVSAGLNRGIPLKL
jgi:hypothetical protein